MQCNVLLFGGPLDCQSPFRLQGKAGQPLFRLQGKAGPLAGEDRVSWRRSAPSRPHRSGSAPRGRPRRRGCASRVR